ncbi:hypothetical protein H696_01537 [Fonticula alba]|uniref:Uncharacterized protein n=1 Tax=Fonticula alba TaxID=691883 RepID=A0A058ZDU9_FONAL|nr:hypothetical protein H696_01537 [Fonticula alba]KCV72131.1 hypothetical protein H696_01537 [Fonticula alba]|eukprot:XP_009493709.1 hypothetical protein H696_01537 [Fonticula alba]
MSFLARILHRRRESGTVKGSASFWLLVLLYTIQGVPLGIVLQSIPFLLLESFKATDPKAGAATDFAALSIYAAASYPYSLKLFWSPIVDSVFSKAVGRRKSWILPAQACVAIFLFVLSRYIARWMGSVASFQADAAPPGGVAIVPLTLVAVVIVTAAATQDVAVDGWALSLLSTRQPTPDAPPTPRAEVDPHTIGDCDLAPASPALSAGCTTKRRSAGLPASTSPSEAPPPAPASRPEAPPEHLCTEKPEVAENPTLAYAALAQTIGLQTGSFAGYTIFFALRSASFSDTYVRPLLQWLPGGSSSPVSPVTQGITDLEGYLGFWAVACLIMTLVVAIWPEGGRDADDLPQGGVLFTYRQIWNITKSPNMRHLLLFLLLARFAHAPEGTMSARLVSRGDIATTRFATAAVVHFPAQLLASWWAARWCSQSASGPDSASNAKRNPLDLYMRAYSAKLVLIPIGLYLIYSPAIGAYSMGPPSQSGAFLLNALLHLHSLLGSVATSVQFSAQAIYFGRIADPAIGGTFLTLLNTFSNLGGTIPNTLFTSLVALLQRLTGTRQYAAAAAAMATWLPLASSTANGSPVFQTGTWSWGRILQFRQMFGLQPDAFLAAALGVWLLGVFAIRPWAKRVAIHLAKAKA